MNQTRKTKLQKLPEVSIGQYKGMARAIDRVVPLGRRAFPARCSLQKGVSPLKRCSLASVEAQVEISPPDLRLTCRGPLQASYIPLEGEGAIQNDIDVLGRDQHTNFGI